MGNRVKNSFLEVMPELNHLLVMATGTGKRPQGDSGTYVHGS